MKSFSLLILSYATIMNSVLAGVWPMAPAKDKLTKYYLQSWSKAAPAMEITLPAIWKYEKEKGPDFDVHWFSAADSSGSIGIYVGLHPNVVVSDSARCSRNKVGAIEIEFYCEKRNDRIFTQGIVPGFFKGSKESVVSELLLHIMINEYKNNFTDKALKALSTLRAK